MSDEIEMMNDGTGLTWSETWIKALTQPTVEAYEEIANDPGASSNKAYIWFGLSSAVSFFVSIATSLLFGNFGEDAVGGMFFALICGVIILPFISILMFAIMTGISQAIAGMLGGTGSFAKLIYTYAAYSAPLTLISTGLSVVPLLGLLAIPLGFYGLFLNVLAVKAVNQFSWGKAVASSFIIFAIVLVSASIFVIVILALLGPAIGDVFSGILSDIQ